MKTGIFGGTFDPPHLGHLVVAQDALIALALDRVLFVPAARPPHKRDVAISDASLRVRMLELALAGDDRLGIDTLELERSGPSWTVDTVDTLRDRAPSDEWTLLLGADQYAELDTWKEPERIRAAVRIAVLTRGGTHGGTSDAIAARITGASDATLPVPAITTLERGDVRVDVTRIDISATAIRRRVAAGLPIRYMVAPAVEEFITLEGLYR